MFFALVGYANRLPSDEAELYGLYQISQKTFTPVWQLVGDKPGEFWFSRVRLWLKAENEAEKHLIQKQSK